MMDPLIWVASILKEPLPKRCHWLVPPGSYQPAFPLSSRRIYTTKIMGDDTWGHHYYELQDAVVPSMRWVSVLTSELPVLVRSWDNTCMHYRLLVPQADMPEGAMDVWQERHLLAGRLHYLTKRRIKPAGLTDSDIRLAAYLTIHLIVEMGSVAQAREALKFLWSVNTNTLTQILPLHLLVIATLQGQARRKILAITSSLLQQLEAKPANSIS